jgi:hypothetical protein
VWDQFESGQGDVARKIVVIVLRKGNTQKDPDRPLPAKPRPLRTHASLFFEPRRSAKDRPLESNTWNGLDEVADSAQP